MSATKNLRDIRVHGKNDGQSISNSKLCLTTRFWRRLDGAGKKSRRTPGPRKKRQKPKEDLWVPIRSGEGRKEDTKKAIITLLRKGDGGMGSCQKVSGRKCMGKNNLNEPGPGRAQKCSHTGRAAEAQGKEHKKSSAPGRYSGRKGPV